MFNVGAGEFVVIVVVALLVLGPQRLPELARGLGKFLREFRRQTDDVRIAVEREFYRMDLDLEDKTKPAPAPPVPAVAAPTPASLPAGSVATHDEYGRLRPVHTPALEPAPLPSLLQRAIDANAPPESPAEPAPVPASPIANETFRAVPRTATVTSAPEPKTDPGLDPAASKP